MEFSSDIILKGISWKKTLEGLKPFYKEGNHQKNYILFLISASIGIMYDSQKNCADNDISETINVPRTVLHSHNSDLDFLFQTAILTSKTVDFDKKTRMDLAFNSKSTIEFKKIEFLVKFANFGIGIILEKISNNEIETMKNLRELIVDTFEGNNYNIYGVLDDELDILDFE